MAVLVCDTSFWFGKLVCILFKTDKVALNNFVECRINEQSGCIWNIMYLNYNGFGVSVSVMYKCSAENSSHPRRGRQPWLTIYVWRLWQTRHWIGERDSHQHQPLPLALDHQTLIGHSTQISTRPRANKQGHVKCRRHILFQWSQHRKQSWRRVDTKKGWKCAPLIW